MANSTFMETESCGKLLWRFSAPAVIGMLATALYEAADRLFIGKAMGVLGISAITIARPIFFIIMSFSLLIGVGASVTISLKLGEHNRAQAEKALGNALLLTVLISASITLAGLFFREELLALFGASKEILPLARVYLTVFLWGAPFQVTAHVFAGAARAEGNPKITMAAMLLGAVTNFILNPVLIFVFDLGIAGSALATFSSQCIVTALMIIYFTGGGSTLKLRLKYLIPNGYILNYIATNGIGSCLASLLSSATLVLLNNKLALHGGDLAVAAFGIINVLTALIMLPVMGINAGMQPILGYNYGARNFQRVKKTIGIALLWSTYMATIGFILLILFQRQLFTLFSGENSNLFRLGSEGISTFLLMLPITSLQRMEYFEAIGKAKIAIFLSLAKQLLFQVPLLLILPGLYGLRGVWLTGAVSDLCSSLLSGIFLLVAMFRLKVGAGIALAARKG